MGTFHVGLICSQKPVVLQGWWKERDVPGLVLGQEVSLQAGTCGLGTPGIPRLGQQAK